MDAEYAAPAPAPPAKPGLVAKASDAVAANSRVALALIVVLVLYVLYSHFKDRLPFGGGKKQARKGKKKDPDAPAKTVDAADERLDDEANELIDALSE